MTPFIFKKIVAKQRISKQIEQISTLAIRETKLKWIIITINLMVIVIMGLVYKSPIRAVQKTKDTIGLPISKAENKPDNLENKS